MLSLRLLVLFLAGWCFFAPARAANPTDDLKAAVLRADEARIGAMLAADTRALDGLLTSDCLYVHSYGGTQSKAELLAALKNGAMKYHALRYAAPPAVRLYGNESAVLTGTVQLEVATPDGKLLKPTLLITAVYVFQSDRWQLASYQSTTAAK
jgi:hypothetical protein